MFRYPFVMANLARVRVVWSGTPVVGGGVSTLYFNEAHSGFIADIGGALTTGKASFPAGVTWSIENTGDLIDVETGALSGSWTDGSNFSTSGTAAGSYSSGVGCRVRWATAGISGKRRVRGSTFLVPLAGASYDTDGTIGASTLTSLNTAWGSLFTNSEGNLMIYTRPVAGVGGRAHAATGMTIPDRVSWLRTRRT